MCLAVPFELKEINGAEAIAERDGIRRKIRVDFIEEPKAGEYVLVHAGFAIERMDKTQAEEDLQTARELQAELAKIAEELNQRYEQKFAEKKERGAFVSAKE